MPWDAPTKLLFAKLVLCGVVFEKRGPHKATFDTGWMARPKWYFRLPSHVRKDYVMGGYGTKSEAVLRAAETMELI